MKLNVHSIFESISGETGIMIPQGAWTTFIRLQGCNLECAYCDTKHTQNPSIIRNQWSIEEIARQVKTEYVLITGGEPLLQREGLLKLIPELEMNDHVVQIETNGSFSWETSNPMGCWIVDYKCPSSRMQAAMRSLKDLVFDLNETLSIVKFVIDIGEDGLEIRDYNFMWDKIHRMFALGYHGDFIISPIDGKPESLKRIADMIKVQPPEFRSRIILSLQIHKICGLD